MQLFSGLLGKKLSPTWEYTVQGVLWRLFPSAGGLLVGEDRDLEKKKVSFFCLNDRTGAVVWRDVTFPEPWWISMEALHEKTLLLHEFAAPDMPDHKKILAIDASTGRTVWSNDDVKFLFAHGDHLYAAKETFEDRLFSAYRLSDGGFVRAVDAQEIRAMQREQAAEPREVVDFPRIAQAGEAVPDADLAAALSAARMAQGGEAQIEYIAARAYLVVALCLPAEASAGTRSFTQRVFVFDRLRRRVVFDDQMHARLAMPIPDMLFCRERMLYYIKERRTLCAVPLGEATKQ